jgi:hypothetical protein
MEIKKQGPSATIAAFANGSEILFSYATPVAGFIPGLGYFRTRERFSNTTSRHCTKYLGATRATLLDQAAIVELAASVTPSLADAFADLAQAGKV